MAATGTLTNPEVIAWAIEESGYADTDLAAKLSKTGVDVETIKAWRSGGTTPTRGQLTQLADILRRPRALFYLPHPPDRSTSAKLRRAIGSRSRSLDPQERFALREAHRRQRFIAGLLCDGPIVEVPTASLEEPVQQAAAVLREWSGVSISSQRKWKNDREAYLAWRSSLEQRRILIMELPLGKAGFRGFALSDEYAPAIGVNTAQNDSARSFTLWHEVAHLSLNVEASCLDPTSAEDSETERWCEETASAVLMPLEIVEAFLGEHMQLTGFELVTAAAREFRTSLRATALALTRAESGVGDLYRIIEEEVPFRDHEKPRRGGGVGLPRYRRRLSEVGRIASRSLVDALAEDRISELEARRILKLDGGELSQLSTLIRGS